MEEVKVMKDQLTLHVADRRATIAEESLREVVNEVNILRAGTKNLESAYTTLLEDFQSLNQQKDSIIEELDETRTGATELQEQTNSYHGDIKKLRTQVEKYLRANTTLRIQLHDKMNVEKEQKERIKKLEQENEELRKLNQENQTECISQLTSNKQLLQKLIPVYPNPSLNSSTSTSSTTTTTSSQPTSTGTGRKGKTAKQNG